MEARDKKLLLARAASLVCGLFGQTEGQPAERRLRVGGSAILIAPYLALTARHVLRDLFRLTEQPIRERPGYFRANHGIVLFQVNPLGGTPRSALWIVDRTWDSGWTDICLLQVSPDAVGFPKGKVELPTSFFSCSLLPPPVGARVSMLGYPNAQVEFVGDQISVDFNCVLQEGTVSQVHVLQRDRGMLSFPCFEVDRPVDGGFSGGPVFWNGTLCGLVSSGSLTESTFVASLWPLCLMEYEYPEFGGKTNFGALFDDGVVRSTDWTNLKPRISKRTDGHGKAFPFIEE